MPRDDVPLTSLPDWLTQAQQVPLASFMTHYAPDPISEEVGRRVRQTGQNFSNTFGAPIQAAKHLGQAATSGTLDVTNPETAGEAFDLVGGIAGARAPFAEAGTLGSAGGRGITAYHGSPHDFDRFDLSKIGTGEGAQAYGHGLYFAENENVAKDYKASIKPKDLGGEDQSYAFRTLESYGGNRDTAIANLRTEVSSLREQAAQRQARGLSSGNAVAQADRADRAAQLLEKGWKPPEGKVYQVSIKADPEHFLDWDKPLSEQSEHVKKVLSAIPNPEADQLRQAISTVEKQTGPTQQMRFENLQRGLADATKPQEYLRLLRKGQDESAASDALRAAGIPGIKYLDQGSRVGGEGTRNYVVFDDKMIDILKKYGLAGLAALPAIHQMQSGRLPLSTLPQQQ